MTPEEELNNEIWVILQAIRKKLLLVHLQGSKAGVLDTNVIVVDANRPFELKGGTPSYDTQLTLLEYLVGIGAISLTLPDSLKFVDVDVVVPGAQTNLSRPSIREDKIIITIHQPKFDEIYKEFESTFSAIKHYATNSVEIMTMSERGHETERLQKELANVLKDNHLSAADKKKLYILERLREEWDLTPKKDWTENWGAYGHSRPAGEVRVSQKKFSGWERGCGISDWYEFENILTIMKQEGLIVNFHLYQDYE